MTKSWALFFLVILCIDACFTDAEAQFPSPSFTDSVFRPSPTAAVSKGPTPVPTPSPGQPSHVYLFANLTNAYHKISVPFVDDSEFWGVHGTANYKIMFAAAMYLQSIHFGTPAQKARAKARVLDLFHQDEVSKGHMNGEQFVVDPHSNFWTGSIAAITQGAWEVSDAEVKVHCSTWWSTHFYWIDQAWTGPAKGQDGGMRLPGTRLQGGTPGWQVDDKTYMLLKKMPVKLGSGDWTAIFWFQDMITKYPLAVPKTYAPGKMEYPLHKKVIPGGFIIWMDADPNHGFQADDSIDWVRAVGPARAQYTFGTNWKTPVPQQ